MRVAQIIGSVTLCRSCPEFAGAVLKVAQPLTLDDLTGKTSPTTEDIVVWDDLAAGIDQQIALSEGAEAAQPFRPAIKPVDAYNAAILDNIDADAIE